MDVARRSMSTESQSKEKGNNWLSSGSSHVARAVSTAVSRRSVKSAKIMVAGLGLFELFELFADEGEAGALELGLEQRTNEASLL